MPDKDKVSISLPKQPKDKAFEEFISGYFQCAGFYIEKNIQKREEKVDILELDIVVSDYSGGTPVTGLVEAKSGSWGLSDVFKVRGWMDYLGMERGMFITSLPVSSSPQNEGRKKIASEIQIELAFANTSEKCPFKSSFTKNHPADEVELQCWRYSHWLERCMLDRLIHQCKTHPDLKRYAALRDYYWGINNDVFFTRTAAERIFKLYETYRKYPHISARCGAEIEGGDFQSKVNELSTPLFRKSFYDCEYNDIQISTLIEHRARLVIMKNALDSLFDNKPKPKKPIVPIEDLSPITFRDGLDELKKHKYFHKYPVFWQRFLWLFGGFILLDYKDKEYELLSEKTGIPVSEIPNALKAFDVLFPTRGNWLMDLTQYDRNIHALRMFPTPFRGMGAYYRKQI